MKVYISGWGTYGLIEFMDVDQNLVLITAVTNKIAVTNITAVTNIIAVTNIRMRVELLVAKPPQEGRFQIQFPVLSLGNL